MISRTERLRTERKTQKPVTTTKKMNATNTLRDAVSKVFLKTGTDIEDSSLAHGTGIFMHNQLLPFLYQPHISSGISLQKINRRVSFRKPAKLCKTRST